jgi:apolipoprotein N-acyltransferase
MTWLAETAMLSHGWRRFVLLLVMGMVAGLSVPPLFVLPALFVAMPFWVWALDGAEPRRGWLAWLFGPAFAIGFAFGWGYFIVAFHWLGAAFFVDGGWYLVLMPFAIMALAALIALFWGLASAIAHRFWSPGAGRIVLLATLVTIAEWLRGHILTGFPFDLLGYALTATEELMQSAALVGIYGLTLVAALITMTPALIWPADGRTLARRLFPFFLALGVIAAQLGYGYNRLSGTEVTPRGDIAMRLVQPMVTEHTDWTSVDPAALLDRLITMSSMQMGPNDPGLATATHVVWPESSLPFFLSEYPESLSLIGRMLPEGAMLLTGAPRIDFSAPPGTPPYNALLAIDDAGQIVASYDKAHLVPFGEFLPLQAIWAQLGIQQFVPGAAGWSHGAREGRAMALPDGLSILALICYEVLFSGDLGETGTAELIFNITNDQWFDGSIGPAQHAHHARLRAVEEGLSLVRTANSGLTFVTDPVGRITAQLPPREIGTLVAVPFEPLVGTPFASWRHWPLLGALVLGLALGIVAHIRSRRRRA